MKLSDIITETIHEAIKLRYDYEADIITDTQYNRAIGYLESTQIEKLKTALLRGVGVL